MQFQNIYMENLEFPQLLKTISKFATFDEGERKVLSLGPLESVEKLTEIHSLVQATRSLLEENTDFSFCEINGINNLLSKLSIEGLSLEAAEIIKLQHLCKSAIETKRSIEKSEKCPNVLKEFFERIPNLSSISSFITKHIDPNGEVPDSASPELASTRTQIEALNTKIQASYRKTMDHAQRKGLLQDNFITIRNNRHVIPLRSGAQVFIKGVVQGTSSSGLTIFLEPINVVPLNNKFISLIEKEAEIIRKILMKVTKYLRNNLDKLKISLEILSIFDSIIARAKFGIKHRCVTPDFSDKTFLSIEQGRHPLLEEVLSVQGKEVIPTSFKLDSEKPCMVISGPNTGGKTATLKTAGLLSLMALSGIPVSAQKMECAIFKKIFAVIGDMQSLAEDLSSFSAHILFLKNIVEDYKHPSLILIDELGSGTDLEEGGALGASFLEYFIELESPIIVTTHSNLLKEFALTTAGAKTAAVEFDPHTLEPTFRLHVGAVGRSNGLYIAERLGLPSFIVKNARNHMKKKGSNQSHLIERLNSLIQMRQEELKNINKIKHDHILKKIEMESRLRKREKLVQKELKDEFNKIIQNFLKEKRKFFGKISQDVKKEKQFQRYEKKASHLEKELSSQLAPILGEDKAISNNPIMEKLSPERITEGMLVYIPQLHTSGTVLETDSTQAWINAKGKRVSVPLEWLYKPSAEEEVNTKLNDIYIPRPQGTFKRELNIIGKTEDEALAQVENFLDMAFRLEIPEVSIIHGIGQGILKAAVHEYLKGVPFVKHFEHPPQNQGGKGKTVINLDV